MDFVWLIGYFRQFLSVAVGLPHMAEFCTVLHQALDVAIISQKIEKNSYLSMIMRKCVSAGLFVILC